MRLIIHNEPEQGSAQGLDDTIFAARGLLAADFPEANLPQVRELAERLKASTPPFFLGQLSARQMADLVGDLFRFIVERDGDVAVRFLPLEGNRSLLLTNTPDAPYLVHSVQTCLVRRQIPFQVVCHPILAVRRKGGRIDAIGGPDGDGKTESLIVIRLEAQPKNGFEPLEAALREVLGDVLTVHRDHKALAGKLRELARSVGDRREKDFLQWLQNGQFIPFSYQVLDIAPDGEAGALTVRPVAGTARGLPADLQAGAGPGSCPLADLPAAQQERLLREQPVVVEVIDRPSPILRDDKLYYIGHRERDGEAWREHAFLGLFSKQSTEELTSSIPALRRRIENAMERLAIPRDCHDWRKTVEILNT
ncbi:MAG TPA: hypothetical protein VKA48_10180, partial [Gammaproteobacteria bacterium]|nr:hypothetical protein [Gammaproteobacteria bacterium]